jgi:hypothetical protein
MTHSTSERVASFGHVRAADATPVMRAFGVEHGRGQTTTGPAAVSVSASAIG